MEHQAILVNKMLSDIISQSRKSRDVTIDVYLSQQEPLTSLEVMRNSCQLSPIIALIAYLTFRLARSALVKTIQKEVGKAIAENTSSYNIQQV